MEKWKKKKKKKKRIAQNGDKIMNLERQRGAYSERK